MGLAEYHRKRDFGVTSEPRGEVAPSAGGRSFVVQKHAATRLHYDFRLELDGVLKSWSVPKGPSFDPQVKRYAVAVEDHPVDYGDFEGIIPKGQYGGGTVLLWDRGTWEPVGDPGQGLAAGNLKFELKGEKLKGRWVLVKLRPARGRPARGRDDGERSWLLIKERDALARPEAEWDVVVARPESVATGRDMAAIAAEADRVWHSNRDRPDPAAVPGARAAALPAAARPALPTLGRAVPEGDDWVHEVQLDGERILCRLEGGRIHITNAGGRDRTQSLAALGKAMQALPVHDALVDGLATALAEDGRTHPDRTPDTVFLLDLLHLDGHDLKRAALVDRKALLAAVMKSAGSSLPRALRYSDHVVGHGAEIFAEACRLGAAGLVSKQASSPYRSGPTRAWRAVACSPARRRRAGGAKVETAATVAAAASTPGAASASAGAAAAAAAAAAPGASARSRPGEVRVAGVRLTHPDRVLYPDGALTKVDLARYYERVGPRMLPHLVDRPLSLLRCPDGAAAACFFAKHPGLWTPRELRRIAVPERKKTSSFMVLDDLPGLVMMAQMNVLEVHTWGSRAERLEEPDQMVLDLDPGPAVKWPDVVAAALRVREALARLDLESFVKTTGGKGLHVMVPLQPAAGWDEVLAFTRAIAEAMARAEPRRYTTSLAKAGREDKILVDYLRNGRSATAVAVFSTRARPGAPVSVPVAWEELGGCRPDGFRLADANRWLDRPGDPWAGYFRVKQRLTASRLKTAVEAALPVTAAGREVRARTPR